MSETANLVPWSEDLYRAEIDELLARDLSKRELAEQLSTRIEQLYDESEKFWYRAAVTIVPFKERKLYTELGYRSWDDYCRQKFGRRDTSINNYVKPYTQLIAAGQDPADFKEIPAARINDIAIVALERGKDWDEVEKSELIDVAKERKPRGQDDKLTLAAARSKEYFALESIKLRTLRFTASQHQIFEDALTEAARSAREDAGPPDAGGSYSTERLVEIICINFMEYRLILNRLKEREEP